MSLHRSSLASMLGPTPIASVTDPEIWTHLVSPITKSFLGTFVSGEKPFLSDAAQPLFPGDEITNLNNHTISGGKAVRFPYIVCIYRMENGALIIKRDAVKFKASAWFGDPFKKGAELIYKVAMRDRRYDGSLRSNDSALLDFPYDDAGYNKPLPGELHSVEVSIYAFQPKSRIAAITGEPEYEEFVANPFTFLAQPETFRRYFDRAWKSQLSPGQIAAPIPDVSRFIGPKFDLVAKRHGYSFLEDAASHYHVAMFAQALGFRCTYEDQHQNLSNLIASIKRIKESGVALSRNQESWVCVLQSLRPLELIPNGLYMNGPVWPQDNISQQNLWMNKPLTNQAIALISGPMKRE